MSYTESNLTDPHYGYDMVTAVTQTSVNATMMEWLDSYQGSLFTQAYVYDETTKSPALTDFAKLAVNFGFDPFDKKTLTDAQQKALLGQKFMFAFQIQIGLPDFQLDKIPPIVVLNQEGSTVTYNLICKTFKIIDLQASLYGPPTWINLDQSTGDAPWQIQFNVDLNLVKDSFTNKFNLLPSSVQENVKNLGKDMFSVQQLYFDLNTAKLSSSFSIIGLDLTSQASTYLTSVFLAQYVKQLANDGGVMLGFGVVSDTPFPKNVSLVPTDLNFVVSAYKEHGKSTTDFPAYTLNYLVMANGHSMPQAVPFAWNWVKKDPDTLRTIAGAVAINRNTFVDFLNRLLSQSLSQITMDPHVDLKVTGAHGNSSQWFTRCLSTFPYSPVPSNDSHVLSYIYSKSDSKYDDDNYPGNTTGWCNSGTYSINYTAKSDIYLKKNEIKNVATVTAHCSLHINGNGAEGDWADYTLTTCYNIGVNAEGRISVSVKKDMVDNSQRPDPDLLSKIFTILQINKQLDDIQSNLKAWLTDFVTNEADEIAAMLNGSNTWVFPGGKTFTFQDAWFSDYQYLIAHVLYADPQ